MSHPCWSPPTPCLPLSWPDPSSSHTDQSQHCQAGGPSPTASLRWGCRGDKTHTPKKDTQVDMRVGGGGCTHTQNPRERHRHTDLSTRGTGDMCRRSVCVCVNECFFSRRERAGKSHAKRGEKDTPSSYPEREKRDMQTTLCLSLPCWGRWVAGRGTHLLPQRG